MTLECMSVPIGPREGRAYVFTPFILAPGYSRERGFTIPHLRDASTGTTLVLVQPFLGIIRTFMWFLGSSGLHGMYGIHSEPRKSKFSSLSLTHNCSFSLCLSSLLARLLSQLIGESNYLCILNEILVFAFQLHSRDQTTQICSP